MSTVPFQLSNPAKVPRILGLSASIVTSKCTEKKFLLQKQQLEQTLDSTVITTENLKDLLLWVLFFTIDVMFFVESLTNKKLFCVEYSKCPKS